MADDGENDAEGDDVLFRELQTTAVYDSLQLQPPERHILTLSRAEAKYQPIAEAELGMDTASIVQSAPEIVVQVRKRAGAMQLLIDGFVSEGTQDGSLANVRAHFLDFHKGLHEDWESDSRIFSPLAIVAAVEDGQHPLQKVTVAVVQRFYSDGVRMGDAALLSEVNIVPHRVSDVRCAVVRAPYPLQFAKPFTLSISDLKARDRGHLKKVYNSLWNIVPGTAGVAGGLWWVGAWQLPMASFVATSFAAVALSISAIATQYGYNLPAIMLRNVATDPFTNVLQSSARRNLQALGFIGKQFKEYAMDKPLPKEKQVTFTLEEFADTLESLAIIKPLLPDADILSPEVLEKRTDLRRERLLWHWLCQEEAGGIRNVGLTLDESVKVGLHVRISIDDPMACTPETQHHEIYCGRADVCYLGAAASGTNRDLVRIQKAIVAVAAMLDSAIHGTNEAQTWPDKYIYAPSYLVTRTFMDRLKVGGLHGSVHKIRDYTRFQWVDGQGPNGVNNRLFFFKTAKHLLQSKLIDPFFGHTDAVGEVVQKLTAALDNSRAPLVSSKSAWVRRLPQRVRSQVGAGLFARAADFSIEYAETYTDSATVREFTKKSQILQAMTATLKQSKVALKRFAREWEAGPNTHIALTCVCTDAHVPATGGFREPPRWSALVLSTPTDVQFAASIVSIPERTRRRLRLVARRAQQTCDKSVLEALGLAHTNADLLACQVFGDLWVAELLAMRAAHDSQQVQMLEQASRRAASRLRAAGDLLLRLVVGGNVPTSADEIADVAPTSTDIALVATQAGRDAGRMLDRILFSQDFAAVRAAMVPLIRNCAFTAKRAAAAFARNVPVYLPHGPAASLFGDRHDGVAAYLRAKSMTNDGALVHAITAAYPSTTLLDDDVALSPEQAVALRTHAPAKRRASMARAQTISAMRFRLASLQMEPTADDAENLTVDELAEALAAVKLGGATRSYYVPFGFGDARPAPTFPPCAAPMFGTVPVFCDALGNAFRSILGCLANEKERNPPEQPLCIRLVPTLDCLNDPNAGPEVEAAHPNTVHVVRANVNGKACATVTYAASRVAALPAAAPTVASPMVADTEATAAALVADAKRAAGALIDDQRAVEMAARVSSTAWNAERVVQAVVAAVATTAIGEEFDAIELTLELPPDGDERSYWYSALPDPFRVQQRQHKHRMEASRLCGYLNQLIEQQKERLDLVLTHIQMIDLEELGKRVGVPVDFLPPGKDWLEVAKMRDALLDTADPSDPSRTVRQKIYAPPVDQTLVDLAKELSDILARVDQGQIQLKAHLDRWYIVNPSADVRKAQRLLKAAARPAASRVVTSNEASRCALVGALGVGMAMLAPLLEDLSIACASVTLNQDDKNCAPAIQRAADAFQKCTAVRLSEACLVVSEHVLS